jgi:acid stress-induced BolA-like protein IbaG/YrbA
MGTIHDEIRAAILGQLPDARVEVLGDGRHFQLSVTSKAFDGLNTLQRHRLVLGAIKDLMGGDDARVHAIDSLRTQVG